MDKFIITYSNSFIIDNSIFAFRKKELFDITKVPQLKNKIAVGGNLGYWLKGRFYSLSKLQSMITDNAIEKDVTDLSWYMQENLDGVFNLK
jgi:hypothetical protein